MAVREFIGARYITKFADPIEWNVNRSYEAIEAVQHAGFTYISRQPVPVGVDIANDDFWLKWADPNAQMEQLRHIVEEYTDNIESSKKTELVVFGDSWSASTVADSVWPNLVANALGLNLHNYAINGAHTSNGTLAVQATNFINDIDNGVYDADKIAHVVFLYGVNDQWTYPISASEATSSIRSFISTINNKLPSGVIIKHLVNFTWGFEENSPIKQGYYWLLNVCPLVANVHSNYTYMPLWPYFSALDMNTSNYFHLTANAQRNVLKPLILSVLTGGSFPKRPAYTYNFTWTDNTNTVNAILSMVWDDSRISADLEFTPVPINGNAILGEESTHFILPFKIPFLTDTPYEAGVTERSAIRTYSSIPANGQVGSLINKLTYAIGVRKRTEDTVANIHYERNFYAPYEF